MDITYGPTYSKEACSISELNEYSVQILRARPLASL